MDNLSGECQLLTPDIVEARSQQPLLLATRYNPAPMQTLKYAEWSELTNYQQMHVNRRKEQISRVMRQAHVYAQCNHSAYLLIPQQNWQQRMKQIACKIIFKLISNSLNIPGMA